MATTLAHSNLANEESQNTKQKKQLDSIQIPKDILPEEKNKVTTPYNVLFKLVKKRKGRLYLDNCCDNVINPKTKIPERIWLLNGAHSIWDSDLEKLLADKTRYERSRRGRDIIFVDGVCRIKSTDTLALEFMRANSHNVEDRISGAGVYDFYEYNPAREQQERHKKQLFKIEMVLKVEKMKPEYVERLCMFFGISLVDELGRKISAEGLKTELMLKADNDPSTFQKYIDSKEVEISYLVKKAIIENKIDLGGASANVTWANGGGFIAKLPASRKAYDYLTELAMTNSDDGRKFKEQLEALIT